ncbi:MAG TPA: pilin [Candidatus Paceibacterota bacterium]|nr:pilin [Candidatus Paceibacterota bacterium]
MRHALSSLFVATFLLLAPLSASAAEATFFGPIVPPECNCETVELPTGGTVASAADWGCILQVVQNSINFLVSISIILVVVFLVIAGVTFMVSGGNPHAREAARKRLGNVVIGLVVILAAWLVVDFVMKTVYDPNTVVNGSAIGPWNAILSEGSAPLCIHPKDPPTSLPTVPDIVTGGGTGGSGGGSCRPPSGGPCSVASLQARGCFGSAAGQAAQICSKESSGNPLNESRTDRTRDGYPYSIGLFQINLTNSFDVRVNGKSCSDAFSEPCQGRAVTQSGSQIGRCRATVTNKPLYHACVQAAKNAATNIQVACRLYDGDWGRWRHSANSCNLPI